MIDLTPIAPNIQKRLFEKMDVLGRKNSHSPNVSKSKNVDVGLTHAKMASRTTFIRMVSGLEKPVIIMGGELTHGTTDYDGFGVAGSERIAAGYDEIYGPRVVQKPNDYDPFYNDIDDKLENKFKRPIPGIKSIDVQFKGGVRALREGVVNWTCWSFEDIDRLTPHFLSVGKTVMIEWGWVYDKKTLSQLPTFIDPDNKIKRDAYTDYRNVVLDANGDIDMLVGIVKNFEYTTREDGGFDCTTTLSSIGSNTITSIQPSKKDLSSVVQYDVNSNESEEDIKKKIDSTLESKEGDTDLVERLVTLDFAASLKVFIKNIDTYLGDRITNKYFSDKDWGTITDKSGINDYLQYIPDEFILEYQFDKAGWGKNIAKVHDAWVRWGWFEDNILSKFTTIVSDKANEPPISELRSVERPIKSDGKEVKLYESTRIRNHPKLKTTNLSKYILPGQFSPQKKLKTETMNINGDVDSLQILKSVVNDIENFKVFAAPAGKTVTETIDGFESKEIMKLDRGSWFTKDDNKMVGTGKFKNVKTAKQQTRPAPDNEGYLRNMLINTKLIKKAFGVGDDSISSVESITITEALQNMFELLNEDINVWNFQISSDQHNPNRNKIIDTQVSVPLPPAGTSTDDSSAKYPTTISVYENGIMKNTGVFFFPVWRSDSMVKSQNLNVTIPNAIALSAMYGANFDMVKTGGDPPAEAPSKEAIVVGLQGKDENNKDVTKENISIALNQPIWRNIGTDSESDVDTELLVDGSQDDVYKWFKRNTKLLEENFKSKSAEIEKNIEASEVSAQQTEIDKTFDSSEPPPFLDDLLKIKDKKGKEAFAEIRDYADTDVKVTSAGKNVSTTVGSTFAKLYGSIFEEITVDDVKIFKMKQPFIDAVQYEIMNNTTTTTSVSAKAQPLILPMNLEMEIDGIGGIFPGNSFHSTYLPKRYRETALFQVFDINHKVDSSGWGVTLVGKMRSTLERVIHTETQTKTIEKLGLVERFKKAKQKSDNKQLKLSIERKLEKYSSAKDSSVRDRVKSLSEKKADSSNVFLTAAEKEFAKDYYGIN